MSFRFNHGRTGAIAGGLLGGAMGATAAIPNTYRDEHGKTKKKTTGERAAAGIGAGIIGATIGGMHGYNMGSNFPKGWSHQARRGYSVPKTKVKKPDWLNKAKTKSEARKAYHAQARKHHPDHGGNEHAMKNLNDEWENWSGSYKEAMVRAMADELQKIAMLGALVGGAAGYHLTPGGIKSKAIGTALGAGAGEVIGRSASSLKRQVVDEPRAREQAELYNYIPGSY